MPVIKVNMAELRRMLRVEMSDVELMEKLPLLGCDIEGYDGEHLYVEYFPNRPDLYSVEGIARAYRAFFGVEPGLKEYTAEEARNQLLVDGSVAGIRDYVVACEVEGVRLTDELIAELMELQEKLHWALGRDRRKVSIGVHDPARVTPPYRYTTVAPDEIRFVPLGYGEEMTPREILQEHPKGVEYGHIISSFDRYPVILDSRGRVLSLPPIINGELTRVTEATRSFFIDVTGTDLTLISQALNILATALAERGFTVRQVEVRYPERSLLTPDFSPGVRRLRVEYVNRMLGLSLDAEEVRACLERMGFGVRDEGEELEVLVPCYRCDIFHEIDLVEDVAIGYGYGNFSSRMPAVPTVGEKLPLEELGEKLRMLLPGYGFTEVMNLMLTNEAESFSWMRRTPGGAVRIKNPISEEHTLVRTSLLPGLLRTLRLNRHHELPQRIFELGDVVLLSGEAEVGAVRRRRLAAASIHDRASFTEIKALVQGILRDLGVEEYEVVPSEDPAFIPGRCAALRISGTGAGVFGEVHPEVLENFQLEYPVAALELDVEPLVQLR
ncbi:MAG: phenylalanine--tRNA ligase subunit beta [Euryarchaeota archaeon]|nr:phenylalanine--tRNA ligase subunit beta [Euryarchaeota archaeon]